MTTLKLPDLSPAEVSFVGRVVSGVQKRGGHIDEVKRLGDGGLRVYASSPSGKHHNVSFRIGDFTSPPFAEGASGGPIEPHNVALTICKVLELPPLINERLADKYPEDEFRVAGKFPIQ